MEYGTKTIRDGMRRRRNGSVEEGLTSAKAGARAPDSKPRSSLKACVALSSNITTAISHDTFLIHLWMFLPDAMRHQCSGLLLEAQLNGSDMLPCSI